MIRRIMVIGYGVMGRGIALSFARGGHEVIVLSRDPARITDLPAGASAVADTQLPDTAPELIIESIPERLELKQQLFARLEAAYGDQPILATNTSGLSMDAMAEKLAHPERFIGIHYFQPAEAFKVVEVIRVAATSNSVLADVKAALKRNGQDAVVINQPIAGFLGNRLQHAMLYEAFRLIEDGIVTAADVDRICKAMFGPRMCVTGLIEQKDISGLATTALTQRNLLPHLYRGEPTKLLQQMVDDDRTGVKTGQGFYDWRSRDVEAYKHKAADKVARILAILAEDD
jgi:3-hydroxybutyryl-CoA dehydrogenase